MWLLKNPKEKRVTKHYVHLLSSAMLPTRVASSDCSMVRNSDWLNIWTSPGLFDLCCSLWRFRLSGRHGTPGVKAERREDKKFNVVIKAGQLPGFQFNRLKSTMLSYNKRHSIVESSLILCILIASGILRSFILILLRSSAQLQPFYPDIVSN